MSPQRSGRMKGRVRPADERQVRNRTARRSGWPRASECAGHGRPVRLRCRQDEKRRPEVHLRWLLPVQFPYAGAARLAARPETADAYEFAFVFQRSPARQITPPVSPYLWHSFGQGRLPRQRPAQAKPVHRPSEPPSKGEMAAAVDDGTHRCGTPWPVATSASRLVVSVRWCILKSIRWYAIQRRIRSATKSIHRPKPRRFGRRNRHRSPHLRDPRHPFPDAWEGPGSPHRRQFDRRPMAQKTPYAERTKTSIGAETARPQGRSAPSGRCAAQDPERGTHDRG